jgi:hypothetical protein
LVLSCGDLISVSTFVALTTDDAGVVVSSDALQKINFFDENIL